MAWYVRAYLKVSPVVRFPLGECHQELHLEVLIYSISLGLRPPHTLYYRCKNLIPSLGIEHHKHNRDRI